MSESHENFSATISHPISSTWQTFPIESFGHAVVESEWKWKWISKNNILKIHKQIQLINLKLELPLLRLKSKSFRKRSFLIQNQRIVSIVLRNSTLLPAALAQWPCHCAIVPLRRAKSRWECERSDESLRRCVLLSYWPPSCRPHSATP